MSETLATATHVDVLPLAGHIGAEITGVATGTPLSDDAVARIRQALLDRKVIDPTLVQDYVCVELQGSRDMTGPQAARYLAASSAAQGVPGNQIVAATEGYPLILPGQQLFWLGSTLHDPTSRIVQAYQQTAQFLVTQGRLTSVPSAAQIAAHIDITFVQKALAGDCPS